jgi:glutamine cyclotransferase
VRQKWMLCVGLVLSLVLGTALAVGCATPSPEAAGTPTSIGSGGETTSPLPTATPIPTYTVTPLPTATPMPAHTVTPLPTSPATSPPAASVPVFGYEIVNTYPHDREAFTQGLVFVGGTLYEGTGLYGRSSLRKVELETGQILQIVALSDEYFGEGITVLGDRIYQLTWKSRVGFVYDRETFELIQTFTYPTEGWGITHDGTELIMSDGSATLHFLDPDTLEEIGQVQVRDGNYLVTQLNELEYIKGEVYANVWQTDRIARIDPETGQVTGWLELAGLLGPEDREQPVDVLNGIAYGAENDRLFVTGKLWPKLFEIELVPRQ